MCTFLKKRLVDLESAKAERKSDLSTTEVAFFAENFVLFHVD